MAPKRAIRPPPHVHLQISDQGVFIAPLLFKWILALIVAGLLGTEAIAPLLATAVELLLSR